MSIASPPAGSPDNKGTKDSRASSRGDEMGTHWLAAVIESADDAIISKTLDGVIRSWNEGAERLFGYAAEEMIDRNISALLPAGNHDEEQSILERLSRGERVEHYETVRVRKDGSPVDISLSASPIRSPSGEVVGASEVARDITERKRAEETLRRREQELTDFLENSTVGLHWVGADGRVLWANQAELDLLGYTRDEYVGHHITEFHADEKVIGDILNRLSCRETLHDYEARLRCKDGSIRHVLINSNVMWEGERFVHTRCITRDVTERKRAEARLRESEARFAKAFNASPLVLTISSLATGRLVEVNDTFVEFTGFEREEALGRTPVELGLWANPREREEGLARLRRAERVRNVECLFRVRDGSRKAGLVSAEQIEIGGEAFVLTVVQDISKRRRAEDALRESEAQLRTLADSIPQLAWMAEPDGHIFWYNRRWYEYTGTTPEEMEGWGWQKVHDPEILPQVLERWRASLASGEPFEMEFPLRGASGELRWFLTRVNPVRDSQGRIVRWFGTNTDVDEQRRASGERERLLESERQARAQAEVALERHRSVEERLGLLVEASGVLLGSLSLEAVQPAILDLSRRLISADAYAIWRQEESGAWHIVTSAGIPESYIEQIISSGDYPRHVLDGPIIAEDVTKLPLLTMRRQLYESEGIKSILVVPLKIHGRTSATLTLYYRKPHRFDKTEVRVASALANLAGSAISSAELYEEQSRMRAAAEAAERRAQLLAEASTLLSSSLDYETTLKQVARLAVPDLADWCGVDMLGEDGSIGRLAVAHTDPAKVEWATELQRRYPPDPDEAQGVPNVLRTGRPELYTEITGEMVASAARDEEHLHIMREIGFTSAMIVPLAVHGKTFGAITFVTTAESNRHYSATDLAFGEDLGRRAAVAIENARLYSDAQESNRLKDEFLATVSHELRTPLTAVLGWAHMLRAGHLDEHSAAHALETIERNARSQAQLIDDLLDVSRIITGKLRLDMRRVDPGSFVESAIEAVRPAAEAKGIRIQEALDAVVAPVSGDPVRLQQVVWNLLSNAIKFTPRGGAVQVRLRRAASHVEIVVGDSGVGIESEFLPHVFDRFRQADMSTTRHHGGLGLGLSIVRHLVELHGGTVEAESEGAGRGSTFTVRLPVAAVQQKETQTERPRPPARATPPAYEYPDRLDGLKLLVVDDEPDTREMLRIGLGQSGAHVTAVGSTQEALAAIDKERPDLLISDIGMPGEDGYDLIRRVRELPPERGGRIPAIALTAYARVEDRLQALRAGYQMHVPKPVELAELVAVAASLARRGN